MAAKCAQYLNKKYTQTRILNAELLHFIPEPVVPWGLLNVFGAGQLKLFWVKRDVFSPKIQTWAWPKAHFML